VSRAVVFAYHEVGVRCLRALLDGGVDVRLVLTHPDDPAERIWFGSVAELAMSRGIETILPGDPNAPEVVEKVRALAPDFVFSFYYRRMLGRALLDVPPRGAFNMHGSLLPKYRGRAPVNWAVLKGETETGATLHEMVDKPDAGRIVDQQAVPIGPDDTAAEVFGRVTAAAETVMRRSLPALLAGTAQLKAQDLPAGGYFGGRRPEDGRIDWSRPAREIHNLVRAVAPPYPGAFAEHAGGTVRVHRTRLEPGREGPPGIAGLYSEGGDLFARCGDGQVLRILEYSTPHPTPETPADPKDAKREP
jgi:methionyl-tRNA formyltransferase